MRKNKRIRQAAGLLLSVLLMISNCILSAQAFAADSGAPSRPTQEVSWKEVDASIDPEDWMEAGDTGTTESAESQEEQSGTGAENIGEVAEETAETEVPNAGTETGELEAEEPGTEDAEARESRTEYIEAEELQTEVTETEEPETEDSEMEEPGTEDTEAEEPGTEAAEAEEPGTEDAEAEEAETEAAEAEEPGTEAAEAEEPGTEDAEAEEPGTEDAEAEEPGAEDAEAEEPGAEDAKAEEPGTEAVEAEEPGTEAAEAEEPGTEATEAGLPKTETPEMKKPEEDTAPRTRTEYVYEDGSLKVIARLENPEAVPDDAEFRVRRITADSSDYNYEAYMRALCDNAARIASETGVEAPDAENSADSGDIYNETNTLLYDLAFMVRKPDAEGNPIPDAFEEYQPSEGSVRFSFEFKKGQLTNSLEAEQADRIAVIHLPLTEEIRSSVDSTAEATSISPADILIDALGDSSAALGGSRDTVEFDLDSLSVTAVTYSANGSPVSDAKLEDSNYNLVHLLDHFNIVSFGNATMGNHCLGGVMVQGDLSSGNEGAFADGAIKASSYIAGAIRLSGSENNGANTRNVLSAPPDLYVGSSNVVSPDGKSVTFTSMNQGQVTRNGYGKGFNRNGLTYVNDNYVDWGRLKKVVTDANTNYLTGSTSVTVDYSKNGWNYTNPRTGQTYGDGDPMIVIQAGSRVTLKGLNTNQKLLVAVEGQSDSPTVINIEDSGKVLLPVVKYVNGSEVVTNDTGTGNKILYNLPNASEVTTNWDNHLGHVLAPKAKVTINAGNYNGCIIGAEVNANGEGHMWSYSDNPDNPDEPGEPDEPDEPTGTGVILLYKTNNGNISTNTIVDTDPKAPNTTYFEVYGPNGRPIINSRTGDNRWYYGNSQDFPNYAFGGKEATITGLAPGTYTVIEKDSDAPGWSHTVQIRVITNYQKDTVPSSGAYQGRYTDSEGEQASGTVTNGQITKFWINNIYKRQYTISKTDEEGNLIGGAELQLIRTKEQYWEWNQWKTREVKTVVDTWTTEEGSSRTYTSETLTAGTYILKELNPPAGYEAAKDITFTIDSNGVMRNTSGQEITGAVITMVDRRIPAQLRLRKVDGASGTPLGGKDIRFRLQDKNGDVIRGPDGEETWKIDQNGEILFTGLLPGSYTLTETYAPAEYFALSEYLITFTVSPDGTITLTAEGDVLRFVTLERGTDTGTDTALLTVKNYRYVHMPETGRTSAFTCRLLGTLITIVGTVYLVLAERGRRKRYS